VPDALPEAAGAPDAAAGGDVEAEPEQAAAAIATVAVRPRMRVSFMSSSIRELP
jgi:hypothetical protein